MILLNIVHHFAVPLTNPVAIFGLLLLIVLIVPLVLNKLNIPNIAGLIVVGILIGPYGLHILENDAAIKLLSTVGLMYIMFTAGLELDLNEFVANRNKSLVFGAFTFTIPMLVGYPVCHYLLGYSVQTSILTASMFATHTLVSYSIVSRLKVAKDKAVAVTVGGTIITDIAVLIILAVVISNSSGSLDFAFWLKLILSMIIFSVVVFFFVPKIAKWFFNKIQDDKYSHYIFVLTILFLCGFLAELGGLEAIIGAFAAGLALNKLIPHSSALMNRIDFFGNALFIPIFLISVGMMVNVAVVLSGWITLTVALVLTAVAISGKWLAAYFTQKIFKFSVPQRNIIFGLSSAHAAATLAVILVGYNANILDEYILNGTIILILITCLASSVVTQKAAKKIALSAKSGEVSSSEFSAFSQEKILLPIANPSNIGYLVDMAYFIKDKESVNPISLLGVVPNNVEAEKNILKIRQELQDLVEKGTAADVNVDIITTIDHNIPNGIVRTARETMTDIVIIGWPGKVGFLEKLIGAKVEGIITKLDKNLFICHIEKNLITQQRIVVLSPPFAERELGFNIWVAKLVKLSQELTIPIVHHCTVETQESIKALGKFSSHFEFHTFDDWTEPLEWSKNVKSNDLLVLVSARTGYISHKAVLDVMPTKLEKLFPHNNKIVVFPKKTNDEESTESHKSAFMPS